MGHTYERTAIEDHIAKCMDNNKTVTSPITNTALEGNNTGIFHTSLLNSSRFCCYLLNRQHQVRSCQNVKHIVAF